MTMVFSMMSLALEARDRLLAGLVRDRGQGIMEYAILVGAIAVVAAIALYTTGGLISFTTFKQNIQDCVSFTTACG